MKKFDVLVFVGSMEVGGTERQLSLVMPELAKRGLKVGVVVLRAGGAFEAALRNGGVEVISVDHGRRKKFDLIGCALLIFSCWRILRRNRQAVAHFFLPGAYIIGGIAGLLALHPRMAMARRSQNFYQRNPGWKQRVFTFVEHRLHRRMRAITANSMVARDELVGEGAPPERIEVIYNGIDFSTLLPRDAARRHFAVTTDTFLIVCVANLMRYKGHSDLLEALAIVNIKDRIGRPWHLLCAGAQSGHAEDGNYVNFELLRRKAYALGIGDHVHWLGLVDDIRSLFWAADLSVLASHEEGMPNSILEAMLIGVPIVATKVGGIPEMTAGCAMLVPARDPPAMAEAIAATLAADPMARAELAAKACRRAKMFHLSHCTDKHFALYTRLLTFPARRAIMRNTVRETGDEISHMGP